MKLDCKKEDLNGKLTSKQSLEIGMICNRENIYGCPPFDHHGLSSQFVTLVVRTNSSDKEVYFIDIVKRNRSLLKYN